MALGTPWRRGQPDAALCKFSKADKEGSTDRDDGFDVILLGVNYQPHCLVYDILRPSLDPHLRILELPPTLS